MKPNQIATRLAFFVCLFPIIFSFFPECAQAEQNGGEQPPFGHSENLPKSGRGRRLPLPTAEAPHMTAYRTIRWLAGVQSADGSWNDGSPETTALAVAASFAFYHGSPVFDAEFVPALDRAVDWLIRFSSGSEESDSRIRVDLALFEAVVRRPDCRQAESVRNLLADHHGTSFAKRLAEIAVAGVSKEPEPESAKRDTTSVSFRRVVETNHPPSPVTGSTIAVHWEPVSSEGAEAEHAEPGPLSVKTENSVRATSECLSRMAEAQSEDSVEKTILAFLRDSRRSDDPRRTISSAPLAEGNIIQERLPSVSGQ